MTPPPTVDEVWLVDFGDPHPSEPAHHRPAIVIGPSAEWGGALPVVIVVPLTTTRRGLDIHVEIEPDEENGLAEVSYAQCELLRAIGASRLREPLGAIDIEVSFAVEQVVRDLLGY